MTAGGDRRPLVLVNSGAYVHQEMSAEFGPLPPAFLPVGLGRLYEFQGRMLEGLDGDLHLTLPESFDIPRWDEERLRRLGFTVLRTPDDLSLGAALLYALGKLGFTDRPLRILHGDTLLEGLDLQADDALAVAQGGEGYRWAQVTLTDGGDIETVARPHWNGAAPAGPRLCGYFAFASARRFAERLALAQGDIYDAINAHAGSEPLRPLLPQRWLDFGHVQTFFRSRRIVTTARAFNTLEISALHVRKRSPTAATKLRAEARWLRDTPPAITPFCARLLGEGDDEQGYFYDTEYEYMPTLAELYVFGRLGTEAWSRVLDACAQFVGVSVLAGRGAQASGLLQGLAVHKTHGRLETYARTAGLYLEAPNTLNGRAAPSLARCLEDVAAVVSGAGDLPSVMHGDFCFSNILYSFRTDRVRLIDPRGLTEQGEFSLFGDVRYDLAKLMHSVIGRYDLILAGHFSGGRTGAQAFELEFEDEPGRGEVERLALGLEMGGVALESDVVWATMISLFLSMAPLHADRPDRQAAFVANALRLHDLMGSDRA